jgi:hypothetical protein
MAVQNPPIDPSPLEVVDAMGRPVRLRGLVKILSVESCAHDLPAEDRTRLRQCVGKSCVVSEIDKFGFLWLSVDGQPAYFCLMSKEVELVA